MFWLQNIERDLQKKYKVTPDFIIYHTQKKIYCKVYKKHQPRMKEIIEVINWYIPDDWQSFTCMVIKEAPDEQRTGIKDLKKRKRYLNGMMILMVIISIIAFIIKKG